MIEEASLYLIEKYDKKFSHLVPISVRVFKMLQLCSSINFAHRCFCEVNARGGITEYE